MHRLMLLFSWLIAATPALADPALNSAVSQETIGQTICTPSYAASVRAPWSTLKEFKRKLLEERGESWHDAPKYELDHIIPVCLGGAPGDLSNLQLQAWDEARRKDRVEIQACRCVCAGKVSLAEAQHDLATDWRAAYHKYAVMICRKPR
jgi:hypothetical protein